MRSVFSDTRWVTLTVLALAACTEPGRSTGEEAVSRVDSSGVEVVQSRSPIAVGSIQLSAEPSIRIGASEGEAEELLHRVFSAVTMPDGSLLISNSGTQELRIYDPAGQFVRSFGREGSGPGEFGPWSSMRILGISPDSVAVGDESNNRLHLFSHDGGYGRTVIPVAASGYGRPNLMGRLEDGRWLSVSAVGSGTLQGEPGDLIRMSLALLSYSADGSTAGVLDTIAARPRIVNELGGGSIHFPFIPLTPAPLYAVGGSVVVYSDSGEPEVHQIGAGGDVVRISRWSLDPVEVSEVWDEYTTFVLEGLPDERRPAYARLHDRASGLTPPNVPALDDLVVDRVGNTWARHFVLPGQQTATWSVLGPGGEWLADIDMPSGVEVFEIGESQLVGKHRDGLGVEQVVVYDVLR